MEKSVNKTIVVTLCFIIAIIEGFDLQAPGIAAAGMSKYFQLDKIQLGYVFSLGVLGMLFGAFLGGRLADKYGKKIVLICSVVIFGIFFNLTALSPNLSFLFFTRLFTGLGLGAAMPCLIAIVSETADENKKGFYNGIMYCGIPVGAIFAALMGYIWPDMDWKNLFFTGGILPLLITPFLLIFLERDNFKKDKKSTELSVSQVLFENKMYRRTIPLWLSFFFTLMITYILINWLPSLLIGKGLSSKDSYALVIYMQIGAVIGTLFLGYILDKVKLFIISLFIYSGLIIGLGLLFLSNEYSLLILAAFLSGVFTTGSQSILYACSPLFYSFDGRGTGVGSAISSGRIGAMAGPLVTGKILAAGLGTTALLGFIAPGIIISAAALCYLSKFKKL